MKEIVMCKDCKNYELMTCNNAHFCDEYGGYVTEEDFCSRGILIANKNDRPTEKGETERQIQTARTMIEKMACCYDQTEKGGVQE